MSTHSRQPASAFEQLSPASPSSPTLSSSSDSTASYVSEWSFSSSGSDSKESSASALATPDEPARALPTALTPFEKVVLVDETPSGQSEALQLDLAPGSDENAASELSEEASAASETPEDETEEDPTLFHPLNFEASRIPRDRQRPEPTLPPKAEGERIAVLEMLEQCKQRQRRQYLLNKEYEERVRAEEAAAATELASSGEGDEPAAAKYETLAASDPRANFTFFSMAGTPRPRIPQREEGLPVLASERYQFLRIDKACGIYESYQNSFYKTWHGRDKPAVY